MARSMATPISASTFPTMSADLRGTNSTGAVGANALPTLLFVTPGQVISPIPCRAMPSTPRLVAEARDPDDYLGVTTG